MRFIFMCVFFHLLSLQAFGKPLSEDGVEMGNGGNTISLEFVSYAYKALDFLEQYHDDVLSEVTGHDLERKLGIVRIKPVTHLPYSRDAENYPDSHPPVIKINANRWTSFSENQKMALAMHELLGLVGKEINTYNYSALFAKWLREHSFLEPQKVLIQEYLDGLDAESAFHLCEENRKIYKQEYFYVHCRIVHLPRDSRYSRRGKFGLKIFGVGKISDLPEKTLVDSRYFNRAVPLVFEDELTAQTACDEIKDERMQDYTLGWKYVHSRCVIASEKNSFYFKIVSKDPYIFTEKIK